MSVAYFSCTRESFLFRLHPEGTMATIRNAVSYIHDYFRFKNQGESRYDQNLRHHLFHRHVRRHGHKNRMAHLHGHGSGRPVHSFRSASVWQHFRSGRLERSADDLRYHEQQYYAAHPVLISSSQRCRTGLPIFFWTNPAMSCGSPFSCPSSPAPSRHLLTMWQRS